MHPAMSPIRRIAAAAVLLAAVAVPARSRAQTAVVTGQVLDAESGQPIAGATVRVEDRTTTSDAHGNFRVRGVAPGERTVWATALGYAISGGMLHVGPDSAGVELALDPQPVRLDAIVATVNRFESRRRAYPFSARVMDRRDLEAAPYSNLLDLVETHFGLQPTTCNSLAVGSTSVPTSALDGFGCVWVRGHATAPAVYVDEVRWPSGLDILATYQVMDVGRIEVYSGGAQVRVYTRWFLDWAARNNYTPMPILLSDH
jgi:hypothetical protein